MMDSTLQVMPIDPLGIESSGTQTIDPLGLERPVLKQNATGLLQKAWDIANWSPMTAPSAHKTDVQLQNLANAVSSYRRSLGIGQPMLPPELGYTPPAPPPKVAQVLGGISQGGSEMAGSMISPLTVATAGTGQVPILGRLLALAFAGQAASQVPKQATQLGYEMGKPEEQRDWQEIARQATELAGGTAIAGLVGGHALSPTPKAPVPETLEYLKPVPNRELTLEERRARVASGLFKTPGAIDLSDLQSTLKKNQISPAVKEVGPTIAKEQNSIKPPEIQDVRPAIRTMDNTVRVGQQGETHNDIIAREQLRPQSIDRRGFVDAQGRWLDREAPELASVPGEPTSVPGAHATGLDKVQKAGMLVKQYSKEVPVLGGTYNVTNPKTGFTVEGITPETTEEEIMSRLAAKEGDQNASRLRENEKQIPEAGNVEKGGTEKSSTDLEQQTQGTPVSGPGASLTTGIGKSLSEQKGKGLPVASSETGSVGLHLIDPEVWKELGFKGKVAAEQFVNRLRNKLGGSSEAFKQIDTPEFRSFMATGPKTTEEVQRFVNEKGPKVEVRKFGQPINQTPKQKEFAQLQHLIDSMPESVRDAVRRRRMKNDATPFDKYDSAILGTRLPEHDLQKVNRFLELGKDPESFTPDSQQNRSHWSSIAPKPESSMPGYTEIAVVKPFDEQAANEAKVNRSRASATRRDLEQQAGVQFPSSHNFPPNTLGFVRGYMETTPEGKKVFHVIEVQSDWAQRVREQQEDVGSQFDANRPLVIGKEPLLKDYERLALKAAIDHARSEGADAIAISDAETAMMTEGHDRTVNFAPATADITGYTPNPKPAQEQGMRLHYDRTLPKIAEELTGEKGQRVEFGEHKMATTNPTSQNMGMPSELRKDLIFRDPSGQPKTSISARMFDIGKSKEDFSTLSKDKPKMEQVGNKGVTSESGMIIKPKAKDILADLKDLLSSEKFRQIQMRLSRVSVPKTTAKDSVVGNQLAMFAQSQGISEAVGQDLATQVLGPRWKDKNFDKLLGSLWVEEQLRTKGETSIGEPWSEIKSEAQYQQLLNAPAIKAANDVMRSDVMPLSAGMHTGLGGKLRAGGAKTGVFVNMIPISDEGRMNVAGKGRQGDLTATLKRGTRFGGHFKGTAEMYETSARALIENMVKGNWAETEKQKLFNLMSARGFGFIQKAGDRLPPWVDPKMFSPIPVQRRMAVIIKPDEAPVMQSQNQTMWVPKDYAQEFRNAFKVEEPIEQNPLAKVITAGQTKFGVLTAAHITNIARSLLAVPEKATAVGRMLNNLGKTFDSSPEVQHKLAQMAKEAGIVRQGETNVEPWKKLLMGRQTLNWFDQAARLTLDSLYQDAVKKGVAPNDPVWRRAATQGKLGEYNNALLTRWQRMLKEFGAAPFITFGKSAYSMTIGRAIFSPGRKGATAAGTAKMMSHQAAYALGLLVATPMVINYAMTGNPLPKELSPGQFYVKKPDKDGNGGVIEDVSELMGYRRGFRNIGLEAVSKGLANKESAGQIAKQAVKDIGRGYARPYAGPLVSAADEALGSGLLADRPLQTTGERLKQAAKDINPLVGYALTKDESQTTGQRAIGKFGRFIGLKNLPSALSRVNTLAHQFKEREGLPQGEEPKSPYFDLVAALRKNDAGEARKARQALIDAGKKPEAIQKYINEYPRTFGGMSKEQIEKFVGQLSEEDKKDYEKVRQSNQSVQDHYYQIFGGKQPRQPRPERQTRPKRFSFLRSGSNLEQDEG